MEDRGSWRVGDIATEVEASAPLWPGQMWVCIRIETVTNKPWPREWYFQPIITGAGLKVESTMGIWIDKLKRVGHMDLSKEEG